MEFKEQAGAVAFSRGQRRGTTRGFGELPKRARVNDHLKLVQHVKQREKASKKGRKRLRSKILSLFLVMFSSAASVGVIGLVLGTTLQEEAKILEAKKIFERRVAPSKLHFEKLSEGKKKEMAGQIHYVSKKVTERARYRPNLAKNMAAEILAEASLAGIDPLLVTSVIYSESAFRPRAQSHMHAYGLMQLQPATAKFTARIAGEKWKGTDSLMSDTRYNMRLGIAYLQYLKERYDGDLRKALMAYNWGPTNVDRAKANKKRTPSSVKHYADTIIKRRSDYHLSYQEKKSEYQHMNASYIPESFWESLRS